MLTQKTALFHQLHQAYRANPYRYWLAATMLIGVLLRAGAAFYLGDHIADAPGTYDQVSYDMLARQLLQGQGFTVPEFWWPATRAGEPTAHWSYLYTLYLAAVYAIAGYHPLVARLIQAVLAGMLMPWLAYRLGCRHFPVFGGTHSGGPRVGSVAAGLAAGYPYFAYYAAALMTETFYILAILWTLDIVGRLGQGGTDPDRATSAPAERGRLWEGLPIIGRQWIWLGLALAAAVLLRQVFLVFIPVLSAWLLWRSARHRVQPLLPMLGTLVGAGAVLILCIAPWTVRNYRAFGEFVLLNTNAGFAFFWGNHPIHGYNFISILPADGPSYQDLIPPELRELNEAQLDRALLTRSMAFIQDDPVRYLVLSLTRIRDYFKFWPAPDSGLVSNVARVFSFGILWPFMAYGLIYSLRRYSSLTLILYLFVVAYTGIHLLSWALIRYRLPVDAVLLVFAGAALVDIHSRLIGARAQSQPAYPAAGLHTRD
jgi:4-amino-4-deoxy-L-arabinose transferase-like glycosyltransferase